MEKEQLTFALFQNLNINNWSYHKTKGLSIKNVVKLELFIMNTPKANKNIDINVPAITIQVILQSQEKA